MPLLQQVSNAIVKHYPQRKIEIVTYTDSAPIAGTQWTNRHQLTAAQGSALFTTLTTRYRMGEGLLNLASRGGNDPLASNATAEGQAQNRRVELVMRPE